MTICAISVCQRRHILWTSRWWSHPSGTFSIITVRFILRDLISCVTVRCRDLGDFYTVTVQLCSVQAAWDGRVRASLGRTRTAPHVCRVAPHVPLTGTETVLFQDVRETWVAPPNARFGVRVLEFVRRQETGSTPIDLVGVLDTNCWRRSRRLRSRERCWDDLCLRSRGRCSGNRRCRWWCSGRRR